MSVVLENVRKTFGRVVAVDRIDLTLESGTFVGLIGHNGAGKSTCLRMITGMLRPTEGRILLDGVDVVEEPLVARTRFGAVPENPALYEYLTAREFLEFIADVRGGGDVGAGLDLTGLGSDADRLIREYSQGMRRKTALAAALLGDPKIIVLDEALNGLDPPSAARVKKALRDAVDSGQTVLLSTHVVETVQAVADRVVMLAHGRVVADEQTSMMAAGDLERLFLQRLEETRDALPS